MEALAPAAPTGPTVELHLGLEHTVDGEVLQGTRKQGGAESCRVVDHRPDMLQLRKYTTVVFGQSLDVGQTCLLHVCCQDHVNDLFAQLVASPLRHLRG